MYNKKVSIPKKNLEQQDLFKRSWFQFFFEEKINTQSLKNVSAALNQSNDISFRKFSDNLESENQLNSTKFIAKHQKNLSINKQVINQSLEEGELVSQCVNDDEDDCVVVDSPAESIVIIDDTVEEVGDIEVKSNYYEDITGSASFTFVSEQKKVTPSMSDTSTVTCDNNEVIFVDETINNNSTSFKKNSVFDDSVMFVSETAPDFIPLVSDNVPKPLQIVPNPFSPKQKNNKQSSDDSFFSKSEKRALQQYNINSYNPNAEVPKNKSPKRMIIIDGSNVAFSYTRQVEFSVKGLQICIAYFKRLGHEVKAVVPQMRLQYKKSSDPKMLDKLYREGDVVLTPCKNIPGACSSSYDDRFILQMASQMDAVIISNDNYRDLINENVAFKKLILNRVVGYTWVNDVFMLPKDPYGKNGPKLDEILNRKKKKS